MIRLLIKLKTFTNKQWYVKGGKAMQRKVGKIWSQKIRGSSEILGTSISKLIGLYGILI